METCTVNKDLVNGLIEMANQELMEAQDKTTSDNRTALHKALGRSEIEVLLPAIDYISGLVNEAKAKGRLEALQIIEANCQ